MHKSKIKIWELSLLIALCISLCEATVEAGRQSELSEKIVRMHVIADSDNAEAQQLKERVRMALEPLVSELMADAESADEAEEKLRANGEALLAAAHEAAGGERVELCLGRETYPYRRTENYALPAGEYTSLRIILGSGEGHNWWGVIFPQLDASAAYSEAMKVLDEEELRLIYDEDGVIVRFRFLELWENVKSMFG